LLKKGAGKEAKLCFTAHALMENRHGFCVSVEVTPSVGVTESEMALEQLKHLQAEGFSPTSVGADKGYHNGSFVAGCEGQSIKAHVATIKGRKVPGLDGRTTRSKAYKMSQTLRKRTEQIFGWMKTVGGMRRSRYRGAERTDAACKWVVAALNLLRLAKLSLAPPSALVRA
jgi:IS5 family transposase